MSVLSAGFSMVDKCNTTQSYYCRVYLSFPYFVELPEISCEVSDPGDVTCSLGFRDRATSGSSGVLFSFLSLHLICICFAKCFEFNIRKVTAFPFKVPVIPNIYTITYRRILYSFGWVRAWNGSWHGEITEQDGQRSLNPCYGT